jgi:hypothetical protein
MFGISVDQQERLTDQELEEFILIKNKKLQLAEREKREALKTAIIPPLLGVKRGR